MKDKGLALLLLIASVGFMVWTATTRSSRGGMKAMRGEKAESIAPLGNQPFLPDREPFTVGYERREEVHTPLTPMPQVGWESNCAPPAVSATETVAVSCQGGECEFKEQPIQAPIPQPEMQAPIHEQPIHEMQAPIHEQPIHEMQAPIHEQPVREGFGEVPRRRAVRDISHANPFMR
jgi:hypothetical protein